MWATRRPQHAETLFNMLKLDVSLRSGCDNIPEPKPLVRVRKASCFVTTRSAGKCPDFSSPIIASVVTETAEKSPDVSPQCAAAADMADR